MVFETYTVNRVPRISVPADIPSAIRHNMLALYRPIKWYARLAWVLERRLTLVGLSRVRRARTVEPSSRLEDFDWRGWLKEIAPVIGAQQLLPAFYFPPQLDRRKCSIQLFDVHGQPVAYGKLAWDPTEQEKLEQERRAVDLCCRLSLRTFEIPALLSSGIYDKRPYGLFASLPKDSLKTPWRCTTSHQNAWRELAFTTQHHLSARDLPWWSRTSQLPSNWSQTIQELEALPAHQLQFSWGHGDFAIWNTCFHRGKLYLFDWENFDPHAPLWSDLIYCVLSYEVLVKRNRNVTRVLSKIIDMMQRNSIPWERHDLTLALVYLATHADTVSLSSFLDDLLMSFNH